MSADVCSHPNSHRVSARLSCTSARSLEGCTISYVPFKLAENYYLYLLLKGTRGYCLTVFQTLRGYRLAMSAVRRQLKCCKTLCELVFSGFGVVRLKHPSMVLRAWSSREQSHNSVMREKSRIKNQIESLHAAEIRTIVLVRQCLR